jgi:hypothetical protein
MKKEMASKSEPRGCALKTGRKLVFVIAIWERKICEEPAVEELVWSGVSDGLRRVP